MLGGAVAHRAQAQAAPGRVRRAGVEPAAVVGYLQRDAIRPAVEPDPDDLCPRMPDRVGQRFLGHPQDGVLQRRRQGHGLELSPDLDAEARTVGGADLLERAGQARFLQGDRPQREQRLTAAVLVLTSSADDQHLVQAIKAGALSYLPKTAGVDQVVDAVRAAARGESVLQPAATARLLRELRHAAADPLGQLTPRETDVLKGLAQGRSNREIAKALSVSEETVKSHVSSILAKLGLADRTQAAIFALQHHLVPLDQALGP